MEENLSDAQLIIRDEIDLAAFRQKADWIVLDDDYAPVENFMTPVVRVMSSVTIAEKYIKQADKLRKAGRNSEAVEKYRMAMRTCPAFSQRASYSISRILPDSKGPPVVDVNEQNSNTNNYQKKDD
jgi:hypothetical protein